MIVPSGGEGSGAPAGLHYPYLTRKTQSEFVYGQHEALGKAFGCVVPVSSQGDGLASVGLHYPYLTHPYLTCKTQSEFVYGQQEALGKIIGCVLGPTGEGESASMLLTPTASTAPEPLGMAESEPLSVGASE